MVRDGMYMQQERGNERRPRPPWLRLSVACLAAGSVSSVAAGNSKL